MINRFITLLGLSLLINPGNLLGQVASEQVLDRILVVVNDSVITASELDQEMASIVLQLRQRGQTAPPEAILRKQVLERLVAQEVQLQQAKRLNIRVTDSQVNEALRSIANSNQLSLEVFRERLLSEGYDYQKFREDLRRDLLLRQVRKRMVEDRINISEQEIQEFLDSRQEEVNKDRQHHLRHIQIALPEDATPADIEAAEKRAQSLRARLRQGEDFAALAISESDGQQALEGGDLGWRSFAQIPTQFVAAVRDLKAGEISDLIRTAAGFHILKLEAVRGETRHVVRQVHARHILLKTNVLRDDETARATLESLRQRALQGEDFGDLARAYSEDYGSAAAGGDLGWYNPGEMTKDFEAVVNDLAASEISDVFQTSFGWHIVQLLGRRDADNTEEFLRAEARQRLFETKVETEIELWLRRLLDEAFIEYRTG